MYRFGCERCHADHYHFISFDWTSLYHVPKCHVIWTCKHTTTCYEKCFCICEANCEGLQIYFCFILFCVRALATVETCPKGILKIYTLQSTISTASNSPPPVQAGMSAGSEAAAGAARPSSPAVAAPRCCDTGRRIFQDPITGQTVCSCQYEFLNYQRLASGPLSMYSAPYSDAATAAGMAAYFPALAADQQPFYTNAVSN